MKKLFLSFFGFLLILVGIVGWILPILPGWPFIFLGLSFIAPAFAAKLKRRVLRKFSKQDIVYLENWQKYKVHAGFTTRHFPLVLAKTEDLANPSNQAQFIRLVSESRVFSSHQVALGKKFVFLNQVHGDTVAVLEDASLFTKDGFYNFPDTDGVITNLSDLMLLVMTADCLSIFFTAGRGERQWVGLVHAGWRGTQREIAKKAFQMIRQKSRCRPSEVQVIFGPRIGKDQYEVGEEFVKYFGHVGLGPHEPATEPVGRRAPLQKKNGKWYFDLAGENRRQLIKAGAKPDHVMDLEICTVSENDNFYSFRKEKEAAGRIISFIKKF